VSVAQLVELLVVVQAVAGSNPVAHPLRIRTSKTSRRSTGRASRRCIDGGRGIYFANAGEGVHAVGTLAPIIPGYIGCIVIRPDKTPVVARAVPDPLA
jgi:hypothetical protein